ncbi:MAG: thiamine diphosphokinase [Fusobacteria bacterium]|nr:thiamine diphosphokinase [Fusobacteriota bacterium]
MAKIAVVVLNGYEIEDRDVLKEYVDKKFDIYACDGGANLLYQDKIVPKIILGDLDSIKIESLDWFEKQGVAIEKYSVVKDSSDAEILFEKISASYEEICVIGGLGKRFDHALVNIFLLEKFSKLRFVSKTEEIFCVKDHKKISGKSGKIISILSLSEESRLTLQGLIYPLQSEVLYRSSSRGLSNVIAQDIAQIDVERGCVMCIINNREEKE